MVSEKKSFKHFSENWPFSLPRQPIKFTDLDKSQMKLRKLLNIHLCKKKSKYSQWDRKMAIFLFSHYIWAATWENRIFAYAKIKTQIRFAVTAKLISAIFFATWIVQSLCFLNPKFQVSSHLLWLYSPVCVGPGQKPRRPVFWRRGSIRLYKSMRTISYQSNESSTPIGTKTQPFVPPTYMIPIDAICEIEESG